MKSHNEVLTIFCIVGLFSAVVVPALVSSSVQAVDIVEDTGDAISLSKWNSNRASSMP
jgi:hypothetical protein